MSFLLFPRGSFADSPTVATSRLAKKQIWILVHARVSKTNYGPVISYLMEFNPTPIVGCKQADGNYILDALVLDGKNASVTKVQDAIDGFADPVTENEPVVSRTYNPFISSAMTLCLAPPVGQN